MPLASNLVKEDTNIGHYKCELENIVEDKLTGLHLST